ncbi:hypothetical protein [Lentilactobacillus sunkii]|uniref:hypothetical protein n=1 Tax=Lentilactobacillus sunkii TaxID=481719 RepID=UPI00070E1074|nr:hypothetical protein [Lentilactobacillus sunkii]
MNDDDSYKEHRKARLKHEIVWWIVYLAFVGIFLTLSLYFVRWLTLLLPESMSILALSGVELILLLIFWIISLVVALKITHMLLGTFELKKLN